MNMTDYVKEAQRQLTDDTFYKRLDDNLTDNFKSIVSNTIRDLIRDVKLTNKAMHSWGPHHVTLTQSIEAIQNRTARFIVSNYYRTSSITSVKESLQLLSLAARRKYSGLCLFHKIYYHTSCLFSLLIHAVPFISARLDHRQKVHVPKSNTVTHSLSFLAKTSRDWNKLPGPITGISYPIRFKNALLTSLLAGL